MDDGGLYKKQLMEYAQDLARAYSQLRRNQAEFLAALVTLLESKAPALRGHASRVAFWSLRLNEALDSPLEPGMLQAAALAHDVGKLGLPDRLIRSWVAENEEDAALLEMHPDMGASLLTHVSAFQDWIPWVRHHHERWDGLGFPDKLAGKEIPLGARIISVANAFDYHMHGYAGEAAYTLAATSGWLESRSGKAHDPDIIAVFTSMPLEALWANRLWIEEEK